MMKIIRCKTLFVAPVILLVVIAGCNKPAVKEEASVQIAPVSEMFKEGVPTPIEVLFFESRNSGQAEYYLSELTMKTAREGTLAVVDLKTSQRVSEFHLDTEKPGLRATATGEGVPGVNDLVLNNYTEWCGQWHKGINNYWQLCTGSDCTGSGVIQWCIKKVDKEKCELENNCPTND